MRKQITILTAIVFVFAVCNFAFSQNIAINTSGAAAAAANMLEVTQPAGAASNSVGIFASNLSTAANAYAIWAEATGAATNKYAIVVPSGGGFVGIGTTTPTEELHIITNAPSGNRTTALFENIASGVSAANAFLIRSGSSDLSLAACHFDYTAVPNHTDKALVESKNNSGLVLNALGASSYMTFETGNANSERMRIDVNGNVGIGTTSPAARLELTDATQLASRLKFSGQEFYQAANTSTEGISFLMGYNRANNRQLWIGESDKLAQNATNLVIRISPSTTLYNTGIIDALSTDATTYKNLSLNPFGANVGIGTVAPTGRLTIGNNVATGFLDNYSEYQEILYDGSTASSSYGFGIKANTVVFNSGIGAYSFDRAGASTTMYMDASGNVGINQTSPTAKLEVVGTSSVTIKIVDGNQGSGKVLTSDANGQGSWQPMSGSGCMTQKILEYTTAGAFTWTWPATCTVVNVECWGAGGGGSAGQDNGGGATAKGGGGGGSGAFIFAYNVPVTGNVAITVGTGGAGSTANGTNGTAGGNSSFGTAVIAPGGPGGGNVNACASGGGLYGTTVSCGVAGTYISFVNGAAASGGGGNNGSTLGNGYAGGDFRGYGAGGALGLNGGGAGSGGGAGGKGDGGAGGAGINVGTGTNGGAGGVAAGGGGGGGNQSGGAAGNGGAGGVGYVKVTWWE